MSLQYFKEKNVFLSFYLNIVCKNIVFDVGLRGPRAQASVFTSRKIKALVYLIQIISNSLARFWNLWIIENLKIKPSFKLIIRINIKSVVNAMHRIMTLLLQYQAFSFTARIPLFRMGKPYEAFIKLVVCMTENCHIHLNHIHNVVTKIFLVFYQFFNK